MDLNEKIERFIVEELMMEAAGTKLDPDQSLISSGVLDSLALLQLVEFIEEQYQVKIEDEDLLPENFQSINSIKAFLKSKTENHRA